MRIAVFVTAAAIAAPAVAHARGKDTKLADDLDTALSNVIGPQQGDAPLPAFVLNGANVIVAPKTADDARGSVVTMDTFRGVAGLSGDKTAAWLAVDLAEWEEGCGMAPCPPPPPPPPAQLHAVALYEKSGSGWKPIVWDLAPVVSGKDQAAAIKQGVVPGAMPSKIEGADDAVAVFEATIGDPKALAASVSSRADVVLYGSEAAERVVGGAKVAAKLTRWNLAFTIRDGISAGVTSSKTVAWIAANVDSVSAKKPKDKPVPYRVLFLYERQGAAWKLVSASFAYLPGD